MVKFDFPCKKHGHRALKRYFISVIIKIMVIFVNWVKIRLKHVIMLITGVINEPICSETFSFYSLLRKNKDKEL